MNQKSAVIIRTSYSKDLGKAAAHVKYIAFRSREREDNVRGAFDENHSFADVGAFIDRLDDPATKHQNNPKIHKLIISIRESDYEKYGLDLQEMTRRVMNMLEAKKGMKLDWVAAVHMAKDHPHVHVAVKSVGLALGGRKKRLRIDKTDFQDIRKESMREIDRGRLDEKLKRIARLEELRARRSSMRLIKNIGQSFVYKFKQHFREEEYKAEVKKRQQLAKEAVDREQERKGRGH